MKNTLTVQIRYSFKGENYAPQASIDLDRYLEKQQAIPDFFQLVARANQIDVYSYHYEVMEMGRYVFSDATGLAARYCQPDHFDVEGFSSAWRQQRALQAVTEIARKTLHIDDLTQHENLKQALLQAYRLGQAG